MKCELCLNGLIRMEEGYVRCECQREKILKKIFKLSETPKEFYKFKDELDDQVVKTPLKKKAGYLEVINNITSSEDKIEALIENDTSIILKGNSGSGKTQMAITLALEIAQKFNLYEKNITERRFFFLNAREIGNWAFDNQKRQRVLSYIKKCKVLIIDDLGAEYYTNPAILKMLDTVLRGFNGIKIITTNLNEDVNSFYKKYDSRLADVLAPANEYDHAKYNCLFYYVVTKETRRKKVMKNLDLI